MVFITGCQTEMKKPYVSTFTQQSVLGIGAGAAVGAATFGLVPGLLLGGAYGTVIGTDLQSNESKYKQMVDKLSADGVQMQQIGDQIKFILTADTFFYENSPHLLSARLKAFPKISQWINLLPATTIAVRGYSDNLGSKERNEALSYARARSVLLELEKSKLDTRLIWAARGGELLPVTKEEEQSVRENSANRVEITLNPIKHLDIG